MREELEVAANVPRRSDESQGRSRVKRRQSQVSEEDHRDLNFRPSREGDGAVGRGGGMKEVMMEERFSANGPFGAQTVECRWWQLATMCSRRAATRENTLLCTEPVAVRIPTM